MQYVRISKALCRVKEARHKRIYTIWFHIQEVLEHAKLIYGAPGVEEIDTFLYLDSGLGYTGCQN